MRDEKVHTFVVEPQVGMGRDDRRDQTRLSLIGFEVGRHFVL